MSTGPFDSAQGKSLTEKYRPTSLDTIWGQDAAVKVLRKFAAAPYSACFIFEGDTGTGKTSAALALASAIGCDLAQKEFGGVQTIASGEQSADAVREAYRQMFSGLAGADLENACIAKLAVDPAQVKAVRGG